MTERRGLDLLTARDYPVYCKPIQKSGCTTLKNLFYRLNNGAWYDDPRNIHAREREILTYTDESVTAEMVAASGRGFTVVRKPLDRFLSFYFDKLANMPGSPPDFPWLAEALVANYGLDLNPELDTAGHRRNLDATLDFVTENMQGQTPLRRNPHWIRQAGILNRFQAAQLKVIPLEYMADGVNAVFEGLGPPAGELVRWAPRFNESRWRDHVEFDALVTRPFLQRFRTVFRPDYRLYRAALADYADSAA